MVFSATPLRRYSTSGCQFGMGRAKFGGRDSLKVLIPTLSVAKGRKRCGTGGAPSVLQVPRYARDDTSSSQREQLAHGHEIVSPLAQAGDDRPDGRAFRANRGPTAVMKSDIFFMTRFEL